MTQATKSTISLGTEKGQRSLLATALCVLRLGAGDTHLSLVKMYPSTSFVTAKTAPTAMQNAPGEQSQALSPAWL